MKSRRWQDGNLIAGWLRPAPPRGRRTDAWHTPPTRRIAAVPASDRTYRQEESPSAGHPSADSPPPGTMPYTCGWGVSAEPQVCNTSVAPICAPRCFRSAAMVSKVSAATSNSSHQASCLWHGRHATTRAGVPAATVTASRSDPSAPCLFYPQSHALAVDVTNLQGHDFADPQTCGIGQRQCHLAFQAPRSRMMLKKNLIPLIAEFSEADDVPLSTKCNW